MASSRQASEHPLESPALGSSLSSLIAPCNDSLRPASPPPATRTPIGATFSGGGFRATFAALGVVRYLADAGVLGDLRYSSSVSGGSVANGILATRWPALRKREFSPAAVDELVIEPLVEHVVASSLKTKLIRNVWRATLRKNRTDVLAWAFDDWLFDKAELESLDAECRWIFNASNLVTGTRFGFERDVVGDYVVGLAPTAGSGLRVAQAVAASAAVPGAFAAMKIDQVTFPCAGRGVPELLDGGAYDNSGLEAIDSNRYHDVFTVSMNAGGVFVTGAYGKIPLVRDLARANSLLYRQSTTLRTRAMVGRFLAWQATPPGAEPAPDAAPRRAVRPRHRHRRHRSPEPCVRRIRRAIPRASVVLRRGGRTRSRVRADGVRPTVRRPRGRSRLPRVVAHGSGAGAPSTRLRPAPVGDGRATPSFVRSRSRARSTPVR